MAQYQNENIHRKINFKSWFKEIHPETIQLMTAVLWDYPFTFDCEHRCAAPAHRTTWEDQERERQAYWRKPLYERLKGCKASLV